MTEDQFKVGDRVKALEYTDCFGKHHAEIRGLVIQKVKHIPEQFGVSAYDRLDCELDRLGEALANRHKLPEVIRVEAAARFFAPDHKPDCSIFADDIWIDRICDCGQSCGVK